MANFALTPIGIGSFGGTLNAYTAFSNNFLTPSHPHAFVNDIFVTGGSGAVSSALRIRGSGFLYTAPPDPFALIAGTVTTFDSSSSTLVGGRFSTGDDIAISGFSIAAATFWNLFTAGSFHDIWVLAAAGNDTMTGGGNNDFIEGWAGSDILTGNGGNDQLWGNGGRDFLYGGEGNDVLVGNDWAAGGASTEWDECWGGAGDDLVFTGGYGSGYLVGEAGVDRMWGAGQSDVLEGGTGGDYMAGGGGLDIFKVKAADMVAAEIDTVMDFQDGVDFIQLAPGTVYTLTDSAFGAFLTVAVAGGTWGMIIQYNTAAQMADQVFLGA